MAIVSEHKQSKATNKKPKNRDSETAFSKNQDFETALLKSRDCKTSVKKNNKKTTKKKQKQKKQDCKCETRENRLKFSETRTFLKNHSPPLVKAYLE